jgi:predicted nuclease of predicted toxin-antitoxin system
MRMLANENFPRLAVEALRTAGHDVLWARRDMAGAFDEVVLQRAQDDQRLVVTFDKDFGELAFRWGLSAECGVIPFRLKMHSPESVRDRVVETFPDSTEYAGHLSVIEEFRIRSRMLPESTLPQ